MDGLWKEGVWSRGGCPGLAPHHSPCLQVRLYGLQERVKYIHVLHPLYTDIPIPANLPPHDLKPCSHVSREENAWQKHRVKKRDRRSLAPLREAVSAEGEQGQINDCFEHRPLR